MARFPNFKSSKKTKTAPTPVTSDDHLHYGTLEEDSGDRWLSSGDLVKALRFYNRAIEYYTTAERLAQTETTTPALSPGVNNNNINQALFDSQYNIARLYFSVWQQLIETGNWQESTTTIDLMRQLGFNVPSRSNESEHGNESEIIGQDTMDTDSIWAMIIHAHERALETASASAASSSIINTNDSHPPSTQQQPNQPTPQTWDLLLNYGYVLLSVCEESMDDYLDASDNVNVNVDEARAKSWGKLNQAGELACRILTQAYDQECVEMDNLGDLLSGAPHVSEREPDNENEIDFTTTNDNDDDGEGLTRAEESTTAISCVETLVAHLRVLNAMFTVSGLATVGGGSDNDNLGLQNLVQRGDEIVQLLHSKWFDQLPLGENNDQYQHNFNCKLDATIAITQWQSQKIKIEAIHTAFNNNQPQTHTEILNQVKALWETTAESIILNATTDTTTTTTGLNLWYMAAADSLIDIPPLSQNWSSYTQADAMLSKAQKATAAKDQVTLARIMVARADVFKSQINLGSLSAELEALVVRFKAALVANIRAYANAVLAMSFLSGSVAEAKRAKREAKELVQWSNTL